METAIETQAVPEVQSVPAVPETPLEKAQRMALAHEYEEKQQDNRAEWAAEGKQFIGQLDQAQWQIGDFVFAERDNDLRSFGTLFSRALAAYGRPGSSERDNTDWTDHGSYVRLDPTGLAGRNQDIAPNAMVEAINMANTHARCSFRNAANDSDEVSLRVINRRAGHKLPRPVFPR